MTITKKPAAAADQEIFIHEMQSGEMTFCVLGTSPLICNRMSEKARHELLMPQKKTAADKAANAKHDPIAEFRASPYRLLVEDRPTELAMLPTMFKGAMRSAALDTPGAKKAQIGRLVSVSYDRIPVYGAPYLFMAITRSADMNKTPDVRTRCMLPEWALWLTVRFQKPILREQSIANLLAAAGVLSGVGDWRQEKGSGSYGGFRLVSADDPDFVRITTTQGRAVQEEGLENPQPFDDETSELLSWYGVEAKRRGFKVAA